MAKYIKLFENHNGYTAYTADTENFILPNVSYCIKENEVHFNPLNAPSVGNVIMAKYRTTSPQENVWLMGWTETDAETGDQYYCLNFVPYLLKKIEIDGVEVSVTDIDNDYGTYTFATVGEHSVNFTLKDEITSIPSRTFILCDALTSVIISSGVTSIGDLAFADCSSLSAVTCLATTPPTLGSDAFGYFGFEGQIYVPSESVNAYKAATNWSDYASDIEPIP